MDVVDPRLQAGRGDEFSASRRRELQAELLQGEDYFLPIGHRIEDTADLDGVAVASTDLPIPDYNKGFQMLQRMGWRGQGLGRDEQGIREPVKGGIEAGYRLGVGKAEQESFYTDADNVQRKKLEVEEQADEDEDRTRRREIAVQRDQRIKEDVSEALATFYCSVCHKQYAKAIEIEVHLSSYDHHHKKRLVELRQAEGVRTKGERDKKERKREEREMARLNEQILRAQQSQRGSNAAPPPPPDDAPPLPSGPPPPPPPEDYYPRSSRDAPGGPPAPPPPSGPSRGNPSGGTPSGGPPSGQRSAVAFGFAPRPPAAAGGRPGGGGQPPSAIRQSGGAPIKVEPSTGAKSSTGVKKEAVGFGASAWGKKGAGKLQPKLAAFAQDSDED